MQCNQAFCGNGFTNGPFYSCNNAPLQCSQSMYPGIVGEGDVTSVTLPDGTIQFFFMPTVKWWAHNISPYQPSVANPNFAHTNCNVSNYNNNVGTWFVRSISNPLPPQRNDVPRVNYNSDYNMLNSINGYQLKFHNDNWTSTTDIHYFYPSLRQREYVVKQPCQETTTVQIQTIPEAKNTIRHYEVVCSKPCNCKCGPKPMSLVSLVQPKSTTKCYSGSTDDGSCDDLCKKSRKRDRDEKRRKKTNISCDCESTLRSVTADKTVTTYMDEGSSCTPAGGRETQTCQIENLKSCCKKSESQNCCEKPKLLFQTDNVLQRCELKEAELWRPVTPLSKRAMEKNTSENVYIISDNDYNGGCSSNCSCNSE